MHLFQSTVCWDDTLQPPHNLLTISNKNVSFKAMFSFVFSYKMMLCMNTSLLSVTTSGTWWIIYLSKIIRITKQTRILTCLWKHKLYYNTTVHVLISRSFTMLRIWCVNVFLEAGYRKCWIVEKYVLKLRFY